MTAADKLGMAQLAVTALEQLGAVVDRIEIHASGPLCPLITLRVPGRIEQALDVAQVPWRRVGGTCYAPMHDCAVTWTQAPSTQPQST